MSYGLVVKVWTSLWMDLHEKGEVCISSEVSDCLLWQVARLEMPHCKGKVLQSVYLCKPRHNVLLDLTAIGRPWAHFLAICCSNPLGSLILAKAYLFSTVTGALETWKIPAWVLGMWSSPMWLAGAGRGLAAQHSWNGDWVELQNLSFQGSLRFEVLQSLLNNFIFWELRNFLWSGSSNFQAKKLKTKSWAVKKRITTKLWLLLVGWLGKSLSRWH